MAAVVKLTTKQKFDAAKIKLRSTFSFLSYLACRLNLIEDPTGQVPTACINAKYQLVYSPTFLDNKTSAEVQRVLGHELFHIVLGHLTYVSKIPNVNLAKWNIATDLKVEDTLNIEGVGQPIPGTYNPTSSHEFTLPSQNKIVDIDKKTALEIYGEIDDADVPPLQQQYPNSTDHEHSGNGKGQAQADEEAADQAQADRISNQASMAGGRGLRSSALQRVIDRIQNPKIDWREMLQRFVQQFLPSKQTWSRCNKRMLANGFNFPGMLKEQITICFAVDTSGSITDKMVQTCLQEMKNIVRSFDNVKIHTLVGDSDLCAEFDVSTDDEVNEIEMKGGGGTSHEFVYSWVKENDPQCCIMFTDGYSDIEQCEQSIGMDCSKMFLMPDKCSNPRLVEAFGEVLMVPIDEDDDGV